MGTALARNRGAVRGPKVTANMSLENAAYVQQHSEVLGAALAKGGWPSDCTPSPPTKIATVVHRVRVDCKSVHENGDRDGCVGVGSRRAAESAPLESPP